MGSRFLNLTFEAKNTDLPPRAIIPKYEHSILPFYKYYNRHEYLAIEYLYSLAFFLTWLVVVFGLIGLGIMDSYVKINL